MGQTACCDSNTNKKHFFEQNEPNGINNGLHNVANSMMSQNKLSQSQNPQNISGSINANLNPACCTSSMVCALCT